jgi:hypothetical protein
MEPIFLQKNEKLKKNYFFKVLNFIFKTYLKIGDHVGAEKIKKLA